MSDTSEVQKNRFQEPAKFLPVVFIVTIITMQWAIYTVHHCIPMLLNPDTAEVGWWHTVIFNFVTFMLAVCYTRSLFTHPGSIPEKEEGAQSPWEYVVPEARIGMESPREIEQQPKQDTKETKRSGDKRYCKWCAKYKPDRCHHCRVCRTCILRMDHHCPWIYNCVGFRNHKYFFLLLFYSAIACNMIVWTMYGSLSAAIMPQTPFLKMFFLLFGETLAGLLGFMVTVFFGFHIWLMLKAMTTIEFCEKSMKRTGYDSSAFNRGPYGNIRAVLGENPLLWMFPCSPPSGDGLSYVNEEAPLIHTSARDVEAGRDIRKMTHDSVPQTRRNRGSGAAGTGELESDSGHEQDSVSTRVIRQESDARSPWGQL